jgi:hypothetical protein
MRKLLVLTLAVCVVPGLTARAQAPDAECRAVLEKAIKAYGGADKLEKLKAVQTKSKATMDVLGMNIAMTIESSVQVPSQLKNVMEMEVAGQKINMVQVFNKDKFWIQVSANGQVQNVDPPEGAVKAIKEAENAQSISMLTPLLKDKAYTLSPVGEIKVNGRTAVGVKVASKGHKDVNLFFDKETGLLAKQDGTGVNTQFQEVNQEIVFSDYKDVDGLKRPMKMVVSQDGKKIMDIEVTEIKFVDKLDDSEFAKP